MSKQAAYNNSADMRRMAAKLALHRPDPHKMDEDDAIEMADAIAEEVARKAKDLMETVHGDIYEAQQHLKEIDRAWKKWDWVALKDLGLLSHEDTEFVREVHAMFTW